MSVRARILANINKGEQPNDCWPWTGYLHKSGRPYMSIKGKMKAVSRVVYEEFIGAIPDGECVCHCCDNPKCLNPAHLFVATQAVNIADMKSKGRGIQGETVAKAKLNRHQVTRIREFYYAGFSQRNLAEQFSVSASAIQQIIEGRTWKHLPVLGRAI